MKIINTGPKKFIFAFAVVIILWRTVAGDASDQLEAMASARVNLRKTPSLSGEILSIVSPGHKVRILQEKGLWCQVDVEGEINGRGWVYARYLERILSKAPATGFSSQTVWVPFAAVEQKQGILPAQLPPKDRVQGEVLTPLGAPLPEKTSIAGVRENSLAGKKLRETKKETGVLAKQEIPMAQEPAQIGPSQVPLEVRSEDSKAKPLNATVPVKVYRVDVSERGSMGNQLRETKNESNSLAQVEISGAADPVPMSPLQPPHSGLKQDALGAGRKYFSKEIEQGDSATYHKRLPGENKKHGNQGTPSVVSEQSVSDAPAAAASSESVIRSTGFHETQGLINKRESIEPVTIALKLLSIVMSCLVILLLYKKIDVKL